MKTDAKDAVYLARLLRLDDYTSVPIPIVDQEPPVTSSAHVRMPMAT